MRLAKAMPNCAKRLAEWCSSYSNPPSPEHCPLVPRLSTIDPRLGSPLSVPVSSFVPSLSSFLSTESLNPCQREPAGNGGAGMHRHSWIARSARRDRKPRGERCNPAAISPKRDKRPKEERLPEAARRVERSGINRERARQNRTLPRAFSAEHQH